nr:unnamed protein product [Digitaria exilis]
MGRRGSTREKRLGGRRRVWEGESEDGSEARGAGAATAATNRELELAQGRGTNGSHFYGPLFGRPGWSWERISGL